MSGLLPKRLELYGRARVVDVFQDTGMEQHSKKLGFGGHVVRGVLPHEQRATSHKTLEDSLASIANTIGSRSVELRGTTRLWHRTIQCTTGSCTCKYGYEGTARNPVLKTERIKPFNHLCDWVHSAHKVPRQEHFDECVANIYSRQDDQ